MPRIKVTGYINTEDLDDDKIDLEDETGLSNAGYEAVLGIDGGHDRYSLADLEDIEFELDDDE